MSKRKVAALGALIDQTRALFHRLKAVAQEAHHRGPATAGLRGVIQELYQSGPQTVPDMARARPVSRQHIQVLVNQLLELDWVELTLNPAHKRSKLVAITARGRGAFEAIRLTEAGMLADLPVNVSESELEAAAAVLEKVRTAFERMEPIAPGGKVGEGHA
jgi:DNA-binding MarR family transcriptional regulator